MKLMTWEAAIATLLTGAIVAVYAAFLSGTSLWLISSGRVRPPQCWSWAWVHGPRPLNPGTGYRTALDFAGVATMISNIALLVAVIGLFTGSMVALTILVVGTVALWLITTIRRASGDSLASDNVTRLQEKASGLCAHSHGAQGSSPLSVGSVAKRRFPRARPGRPRPTGQLSDRPIAP